MRSLFLSLLLAVFGVAMPAQAQDKQAKTILVAAAASLQYSYVDDLIPLFRKKYPWITVEGTYDSSGKLQAQIENGLDADVFMSAAPKQMNALISGGFIDKNTVTPLLENKIVLICPASVKPNMNAFTDIVKADVIAVGDPDSVPAGQYAREALTSLGLWELVLAKASLGTNVTEVLNWVAENSADAGIVYATDAVSTAKVTIIAEAPEGSLKQKVIYPVGILKGSANQEEAKLFVDFLKSDEGVAIFRQYGFSPAN